LRSGAAQERGFAELFALPDIGITLANAPATVDVYVQTGS
jgi:hypothetical protein